MTCCCCSTLASSSSSSSSAVTVPLYIWRQGLTLRQETMALYFHQPYLSVLLLVQDVTQLGTHLESPVSGKKD
ncbi:hypothetical protein XENTR_v10020681 [Xenopus tropicalis]|nr:hypothetical protein XENTR_v10020681 [Xenopus tropicalis]